MDIKAIQSFKDKRTYLPKDFKLKDWDSIKDYFNDLQSSEDELKVWLKKWSELDAFLDEDMAWRYIKMTCDTNDENLVNAYAEFVEKIMPSLTTISNELNKLLLANPSKEELKNISAYAVMFRGIEKEVEIFREENVALKTEEQLLEKEYGEIAGAMTIEWEGEELPLPVASSYLENKQRDIRKSIWHCIADRRLQDQNALDQLFNEMIKLRQQIAVNTGYENYRDYKFDELGRFDYTKADCFSFHHAIQEVVLPIVDELMILRKQNLEVEQLRVWDLNCDLFLADPLKPFNGQEELVNKTIDCFDEIDPYFSDCIETMRELGHLDLESRKGKAPGGYNYPLNEIGIPFIFMNAAGTVDDVITMVHEGGHAIHSFLTRDLALNAFKETPSEVAELASMSMELISMEHWHHFFTVKEELRRAKLAQLERVITVLPWVATVDAFQHWIYEHPNHSTDERTAAWMDISKRFSSKIIDGNGLEKYSAKNWQNQLHIFEVPFYYVEYAMAQLGAIAIWKQYKEDPKQGLANYKAALKLGYTKTIPEIFEAAGIKFDFSEAYIKDLMSFVKSELDQVLK
jgi:oligoendopeptidase F